MTTTMTMPKNGGSIPTPSDRDDDDGDGGVRRYRLLFEVPVLVVVAVVVVVRAPLDRPPGRERRRLSDRPERVRLRRRRA